MLFQKSCQGESSESDSQLIVDTEEGRTNPRLIIYFLFVFEEFCTITKEIFKQLQYFIFIIIAVCK